jgi:hypothetical protein
MYTCRQMSGKRGKDTGCELKADDQVHRHVSTTSKSIQKLNVETWEHAGKPWVSIKKAECEGIRRRKCLDM